MLDGLPGHQEAQGGEPPRGQTREMLIRFVQRERSAGEGDIAVVEKAFPEVRCAVWPVRRLAAAAQVDPAQHQCAAVLILEMGTIDADHMHLIKS